MWGEIFSVKSTKKSSTRTSKITGRGKMVEIKCGSGKKNKKYYIKDRNGKWKESTYSKYLVYKKKR